MTYYTDIAIKAVYQPWPVAQLPGALSYTPKVFWFYSPSEHIPRLWVRSLVGAHLGDNRLKFLMLIVLSLSFPLSKNYFKKHFRKTVYQWNRIKSLEID